MATIIHADDPATFDREVIRSDIPVVVDFWADWCGPCRMIGPELAKLATAHAAALKVVKVDVDANGTVAGRYGIRGIPTVALFRDGQAVATSVGAKPRPRSKPTSGAAMGHYHDVAGDYRDPRLLTPGLDSRSSTALGRGRAPARSRSSWPSSSA